MDKDKSSGRVRCRSVYGDANLLVVGPERATVHPVSDVNPVSYKATQTSYVFLGPPGARWHWLCGFRAFLAPSEGVLAPSPSTGVLLHALCRTGGGEYLSGAATYCGRYVDTRGRKRGVRDVLKPVLFTILDMGFREDILPAARE